MHANVAPSERIVAFDSAKFKELTVFYDEPYQLCWYYMNAKPRPCFTPTLLKELYQFLENITDPIAINKNKKSIKYTVVASRADHIFNLGGDLELFRKLILNRDKESLLKYAKYCIDVIYKNYSISSREITSMALIQGDALGGGLEAALATDIIIAEEDAKMGFPEILFNLFPGMGAYSFLSRKIGPREAEKIILGGKIYSAKELYDLGVVDILAEKGQGEIAVYNYIKHENRCANGIRSFRQAKRNTSAIDYSELQKTIEIWANAAMELTDRDIRMIDRLLLKQSTKIKPVAA